MAARPKFGDRHTRRHARECAVQFLFGLDFTQYHWEEVVDDFWRAGEAFDHIPADPAVRDYALELIKGVMDNLGGLDGALAGAIENWAPERVGRLERNILRVALYEIRHQPDVPRKVAINEAIEIARRFGGDEAPRFINGVLDRAGRDEESGAAPPSPGDA